LKFILLAISLALLIIALAGPRVGVALKEVEKKGSEIIIALDVSNSMLAEDIKPSRLEVAKQSLNRMLNQMENDKIGLIVFAGDAYTQIPVTTDYGAARLFLNTVSTDMVSKQGTAIGSAIELASRSFTPESEAGEESAGSRALIIITDGENHEDNALSAAEEAAGKGIVIHTIGLGDPDGVPLPVAPGSDRFRKDSEGKIVISKLDETTLKQIASAANGFYVRAGNNSAGLNQLLNKLDELEEQEFTSRVYSEYAERYQYFIGAALFLLILELLISFKRNKWLENLLIFKSNE
jgi:Ca-activated chloride channel family protein